VHTEEKRRKELKERGGKWKVALALHKKRGDEIPIGKGGGKGGNEAGQPRGGIASQRNIRCGRHFTLKECSQGSFISEVW